MNFSSYLQEHIFNQQRLWADLLKAFGINPNLQKVLLVVHHIKLTIIQMTFLEDFIKKEEQKMTWFDKLTMNCPIIRPTNIIACNYPNIKARKQIVIKPSIVDRLVAIPFFLFGLFFWTILLKMTLEFQFPFVVIFLGLLFVTFLLYLLIRSLFFNKKYIYKITLDVYGIKIDFDRIDWTDISEICIMNKQGGRSTNSWLLIFLNNNTIKELNLLRFRISDKKLSAYIEFYRAKKERKTSGFVQVGQTE